MRRRPLYPQFKTAHTMLRILRRQFIAFGKGELLADQWMAFGQRVLQRTQLILQHLAVLSANPMRRLLPIFMTDGERWITKRRFCEFFTGFRYVPENILMQVTINDLHYMLLFFIRSHFQWSFELLASIGRGSLLLWNQEIDDSRKE